MEGDWTTQDRQNLCMEGVAKTVKTSVWKVTRQDHQNLCMEGD